MANVKISALSAAAAIVGTETLPIVQSAATVAATVNQLGTKILASAALTGTPVAPTASINTNSTQVATTAYADRILSVTVVNSGTSITVAGQTHNNNTLVTTATSAVTLTLNTGVSLPSGMAVIQKGSGGIVTLAGTATFRAPNGQATSGVDTTMTIVPTGVTDEYEVIVSPTADKTLVNAAAGATPTIDMAKYNVHDLTLTANCTPSFSGSVSGQAFSVTLILRQDGTGGRTLTLPTTKWSGGTAPTYVTTASAINIITLMTVDGGSTYFGFIGGTGMA